MFWKVRPRPAAVRACGARPVTSRPPRTTLAGAGDVDAREHVQGRRLARPVRPDQGVHAAAAHRKRDVVHRLQAPEVLAQVLDLERHGRIGTRRREGQLGGRGGERRRGQPAADTLLHEAPDAVGHVADDEDDRQPVDRQVQARHALQEAQAFRQHDQQRSADQGSDRRGDAAEQRHGDEHDRFGEAELVGADVGEAAGEEAPADAAEHGTQRERRDLDAIDVDAGHAGGQFVVAHRPHGAAERRLRQAPDQVAQQGHHRDAEAEVGVRRFEEGRSLDVADPVGSVRDGYPVDHDEGDDLLEADGHHRQVVPAQAQRRHAEEGAHHERDAAAHQQGDPEVEVQVGRAQAHRIGAEAEEGRLRQVDLPAQAQHHGQAEHGNRVAGRLHQDMHGVVGQGHPADQRHHQQRQRGEGDRADEATRRRRRDRPAHAFSATRSPKMPCGRKIRNATSTRKAKPSLYGTEM